MQQLRERREVDLGFGLHPSRLQDIHIASSRPRIGEQRGLTHPRFTGEDQNAAPARAGIDEQPIDDSRLGFSAYEPILGQRIRPSASANYKAVSPSNGRRRLRLQASLNQHYSSPPDAPSSASVRWMLRLGGSGAGVLASLTFREHI